MKAIMVICIAGCGSHIERAETLIDDSDYVEARAILAREPCVERNEALRCALVLAIAADGVGDREARDAWTARARVLAREQKLAPLDQSRFDALVRRVVWERQVDRAAAAKVD